MLPHPERVNGTPFSRLHIGWERGAEILPVSDVMKPEKFC